MTDREKLEKLKKLADAMYYAAMYLTTDASRLHKAMDEYHKFIINEYKEEPKDKCKGCNNVKGCITCVDGSEYAHIEEYEEIIDKCLFDDEPEIVDLGDMPFGARNSELKEAIYYIPEGYHAIIDGDKVIIKKQRLL